MKKADDVIDLEQRESKDENINFQSRNSELNKPNASTEIKSHKIINKIQLSSKSRILLILRILLLCFVCIFIPMETILYYKLEKIETTYVVGALDDYFGKQLRKSIVFYYMSIVLMYISTGKDAIMIYISVMYMLSHPFLALKLVMTTNLLYYVMTILRCLYQSKRPFWLETASADNVIPFCPSNYANPSNHFFLVSFFFLYTILSIQLLNKNSKSRSFLAKCLFCFFFFILVILTSFLLIINKLHFIYQLVFTLCLSLIIICVLLDFENSIHNLILKALKNIFKTRKYKMKVFFLVLSLTVISILTYFFIVPENLNSVEENMGTNSNCLKEDKEELGLLRTFKEIPYVCGILGAFWGASFTIEYDCDKWWVSKMPFLLIKISITVAFCAVYFVIFHFIGSIMYELDFLLECIKYFLFYYIIMGILPVIFNYMKLNRVVNEPKKDKNALFTATIFFDNQTNESKTPLFSEDDQIKESAMEEESIDERDPRDEFENRTETIYKKSMITQDLRKQKENKLEFTLDSKGKGEEEKHLNK